MGIFSSIVSGIAEAVHWVDSNSGLIGDAAATIAEVAGMLGLLSAENNEECDNDHIMFNYQQVNDYLEKTVENLELCSSGEGGNKLNRKVAQLTGIWTDPVKTTEGGDPSPEMYRDIARMFSLNKFHPVVGDHDVAQKIAEALAALDKPFKPPSDSGATNDNGKVRLVKIEFNGNDTQPDYHGSFLYYPIPMGKGGEENAWHGSLLMKRLANDDTTIALQQEQERLVYFRPLDNTTDDSWCVTFEIDWQHVKASHLYGPKLVELFPEDGRGLFSGYRSEYSKVLGELQTVKLQAPATDTPAGIRGKLINAVDTVMGMSPKDTTQQKPDISLTVAAFRAGSSA